MDFYAPTDYKLDQHFPWGHCSEPATTSARRRCGRTLTKLRRCFAWRVKCSRRRTYTFRGTCTVDPSTFGTRHRPWTLPRRCGPVGTRTTTRTPSNLRFIFDEDWHWKYNDAFYVVHSSRANAFWGHGTGALRSIACRKSAAQIDPETAIFHVADLRPLQSPSRHIVRALGVAGSQRGG